MRLRDQIATLRRLDAEVKAYVRCGVWFDGYMCNRMAGHKEKHAVHLSGDPTRTVLQSALVDAMPELLRAAEAWCVVLGRARHTEGYEPWPQWLHDAVAAYRCGEGEMP